jgi:hypothetical protein
MNWMQILVLVTFTWVMGAGFVSALWAVVRKLRRGEGFEGGKIYKLDNERSAKIVVHASDRLTAKPSRKFAIKYAILLAGAILISANILGIFGPGAPSWRSSEGDVVELRLAAALTGASYLSVEKVFLAIMLPLMVLGCGYYVRALFSNAPGLVMDQWGIRCMAWSDAVVPWHAIKGVERHHRKKSDMIFLHVDPQRYPSKHMLVRLIKSGKMPLSVMGMDRGMDEVLAMFRVHRPDLYRKLIGPDQVFLS